MIQEKLRRPGPSLPAKIGPYAVKEVIARGGMGFVVQLTDEDYYQRPLAMKVMGDRPFESRQRGVERFDREARLTGRLQHPGIPPVYGRGQLPDGRPYYIIN
jgi:serine/threonine-protein kinase